MQNPHLQKLHETLGGDPELFIVKGNEIVGSERVIPEEGLGGVPSFNPQTGANDGPIVNSSIIRDGIQVEFNMKPFGCRARAGGSLHNIFNTLVQHLATNFPDHSISFEPVVEVSSKELKSLSEKSRRLGCAPSFNFYDPSIGIEVDPDEYRIRSAGGHIHIGLQSPLADMVRYNQLDEAALPPLPTLVPILDFVVGNTCVLIDKDPRQAERRKVYGRAGEFRLPKHGLEYRTLSNFWLKSYPLMSLVMGLVRTATWIWYSDLPTKKFTGRYEKGEIVGSNGKVYPTNNPVYELPPDKGFSFVNELLSKVDLNAVRHAIDTNDQTLARENFNQFKKFLTQYHITTTNIDHAWSLGENVLEDFEYFLSKDLDHWFHDPITEWGDCARQGGWENFIMHVVAPQRREAELKKLKKGA